MNTQENSSKTFSERQLRLAYWFVSHKFFLKRAVIALLVVLNIFFWGYAAYGAVNIWLLQRAEYLKINNLLPQNLITYSTIHEALGPRPLQVSDVQVITSRGGDYDLVATLNNPNDFWLAYSFAYSFEFGGRQSKRRSGFIFPGQSKILTALSVASESRPLQATLNISNLSWQRVDKHRFKDPAAFISERLNFEISNIKYSSAGQTGLAEKLPVSRATFDALNKSAYNYWQVGFYVLAYRGSLLSAINYVAAPQFKSGEKRSLEVRWFEPLAGVTSIEIMPEVNVFDGDAYMEFEGDSAAGR